MWSGLMSGTGTGQSWDRRARARTQATASLEPALSRVINECLHWTGVRVVVIRLRADEQLTVTVDRGKVPRIVFNCEVSPVPAAQRHTGLPRKRIASTHLDWRSSEGWKKGKRERDVVLFTEMALGNEVCRALRGHVCRCGGHGLSSHKGGARLRNAGGNVHRLVA